MKPIHFAATAVRVSAVCLFAYSFTLLMNAAITLPYLVDAPEFVYFAFAQISIIFLICIVLWFFPISISRKITGISENTSNEELSFTSDEFLSICLFVVGIYFAYDLIADLIYFFGNLYQQSDLEALFDSNSFQKIEVFILIARSILTLSILLGNRLLVKAFRALRYGT